jgi:hypothetical protein
VTLSWFTAAVALWLSADGVMAKPRLRLSSSPNYRNFNQCPQRCADAGPNTGNWSAYPSFKSVSRCEQTMFFDFSLYDPVDDPSRNHNLFACSSFGPDFDKLPATAAKSTGVENPVDVHFEIGYWNEGFGLAVSSVRSLIKQMRAYAERGHGATESPFMMFGRIGQASVGLYIGEGLQNQGLVDGMKMFEDRLQDLNFSTPSLAMQLCGPEYDSTHTFGLMITSNGTFAPIQDALKAWDKSQCLSFEHSSRVSGQATFTTPLISLNGTANSTIAKINEHRGNILHARHSTIYARHHALHARTECGKTVQVGDGDSCGTLATKCGLPPAAFSKIHPEADFCSKLMPKQHVCCTAGTLPDFSPKPNSDGSCNTYTVKANDNCDSISAEYSLSREKLNTYNKNTWGWNGCSLETYLFPNQKICLSTGSPPFPDEIANAQCGPQKPGTQPPMAGTNITEMNPCPLNACCNIWGQCGLTKDYCVDTNTGSPGTAKKDTFGCISNCGMDIIKGDGTGAIKVAYFEGYGFGRKCLFQDASQVDTSLYTNLHFGFGTLTANYEVGTGDALSTYQFGEFSRLTGVKKILSFGGWDFSTMPATYMIFREGVTPANRLKMATSIADFIKKHNLNGVDIDWEYPGAPDIPGIPAGGKDDGKNYLAFLATLKNLLPGKSVSIAAPASYWYLKQFPIKEISKVVDYIVFMTYDLHGQWDATNAFSQEGCDNGSCLRSQVNLTETKLSLAMITKAGVPGRKVIVGVTSYGRSYKMAQAGCSDPSCQYTGDSSTSYAAKGPCTDTAGYYHSLVDSYSFANVTSQVHFQRRDW